MGISPWRRKLSDEEIAEIHRLYDEGKNPFGYCFRHRQEFESS